MKKIFTLLATLVACITVNAAEWSIDFSEIGSANNLANKTGAVISSAVSSGMGTVTLGSQALNSQFGLQTGTSWFYKTDTKGLYSFNSGNRKFGVFSAKAGQTITIKSSAAPTPTNATLQSASEDSNVRIYTVTSDGDVTFNFPRYETIYSIALEGKTEGCDAPSFKVTGASNEARTITMESLTTDAEIYYSETELTSATGGTKYTGAISTSAAKIWAYAKTSDATSTVVSFETGAGTTITLNVPDYTMSFVQNGKFYNPVFTLSSDQENIIGKPEVTYTYSVNGGQEESGNSFAVRKACTINVTANADGYTSSNRTIEVPVAFFKKVKSYDFTSFDSHSETTVGSAQTIGGKGHQAYSLDADAVEDFTLDNVQLMWEITANKARGLYCRLAKASATYDGEFPENAMLCYMDMDDNAHVSSSKTINLVQYESIVSLDVYLPLSDADIDEMNKAESGFIPGDGPTYDPDKAPEGGIESATRPEHGMVTPPSDTTQNDNTNGTATGINGAEAEAQIVSIVNVNGAKVNSLQKGINIVTYSNGKRVKIMK